MKLKILSDRYFFVFFFYRKVLINAPSSNERTNEHKKIQRRPTGYISANKLEKIDSDDSDIDER